MQVNGNGIFGDGNSSTDQNPEHTFFIPGNYTVNLTVTNENGSSSKFVEITVLEQSNPVSSSCKLQH